MISIRKYLNAAQRLGTAGAGSDVDFSEELCRLSSAILDSINQYVLAGDSEPLREQLLQVKSALRPDMTVEEVDAAGQSVALVLAGQQAAAQRARVHQLVEAQHIFALLNQALVILTEGNDRGMSRLATIQESLQKTSRMRDIASMTSSLENTLEFIKAESAEARQTAAREMAQFETEVSSARDFLGGARLELSGRPEGVAEIAARLKGLAPGDGLYLVAYLCNRLSAVTQRYGPGVRDELIFRLIKERIRPVMPGNTMYRWTVSSVVAVFTRPRDAEKLRKEVAELNRTPLVHMMAMSGRTAVLTISPSHLVAEGVAGSADLLIDQVDRFAQVTV